MMRPRNGISVRPGMKRSGAVPIFSPTKPAPISPDRPMPRMVSASPVATWLTARPSVIKANTSDSKVPAAIPQSAPMMVEPETYAPPKPQAAPTIIMPSTPRLSTPARSVTSSPVAAISNGVDAASTARMIASSSPTGHLWRGGNQPEAVENVRVAGEHVEQQDALEHLGHIQRNFHRDLGLLAADKGQCEEKSCNKYSNRVQAAEKRDDDGGEAIARRNAGLQMSDRSRELDASGKAGHG